MPISYNIKQNERLVGQSIVGESHIVGIIGVDPTVVPGVIRLIEVPEGPTLASHGGGITGSGGPYNEILSGTPTGGQFLVDYTTGVITFAVAQDGNTVLVSYTGLGSEISAEDVNQLQVPVGIALNYNGSLSNNIVKPVNISNTGTDDFTFPRNVIVTNEIKAVDFATASASPATTGVVRLAATDTIAFGTSNYPLTTDGSGNLTWRGDVIATSTGDVTSITGTINQIIASSSTGNITLSTPQNINTTSSPTFVGETLTGLSVAGVVHNSAAGVLSTSLIVNADINSSAAIAYSKLATLGGSTNDVLIQSAGGFVTPSSILSTNLFLADGSVTATGAFNMGSHKISSVTDPTLAQDAATKNYVDTNFLMLTGGTLTGSLGIGESPDPSAELDVASTTKGFLPPRMTTTQQNAISSPAAGLIIFNTSTNQFSGYNGTSWVILG